MPAPQANPRMLLIQQLQKAIQGEHEAIQFYKALEPMAPPSHQKYIRDIREEERTDHLLRFTNLYRQLTGRNPLLKPGPLPHDYISGLKRALDDEQEAASFYKDVYLSSQDPYVRRLFFDAMNDEMRHATRIAFLYSNYFLEQGKI
ncbi:ferritin family protein [Brevibacillus ginsengisoli]|uniref:ferritin family protein n=1 Tax=Brevibacillus ginsengisoli TaxID=363854 RepID=UPI003CF31ACB